jgi:hypothetical protein
MARNNSKKVRSKTADHKRQTYSFKHGIRVSRLMRKLNKEKINEVNVMTRKLDGLSTEDKIKVIKSEQAGTTKGK